MEAIRDATPDASTDRAPAADIRPATSSPSRIRRTPCRRRRGERASTIARRQLHASLRAPRIIKPPEQSHVPMSRHATRLEKARLMEELGMDDAALQAAIERDFQLEQTTVDHGRRSGRGGGGGETSNGQTLPSGGSGEDSKCALAVKTEEVDSEGLPSAGNAMNGPSALAVIGTHGDGEPTTLLMVRQWATNAFSFALDFAISSLAHGVSFTLHLPVQVFSLASRFWYCLWNCIFSFLILFYLHPPSYKHALLALFLVITWYLYLCIPWVSRKLFGNVSALFNVYYHVESFVLSGFVVLNRSLGGSTWSSIQVGFLEALCLASIFESRTCSFSMVDYTNSLPYQTVTNAAIVVAEQSLKNSRLRSMTSNLIFSHYGIKGLQELIDYGGNFESEVRLGELTKVYLATSQEASTDLSQFMSANTNAVEAVTTWTNYTIIRLSNIGSSYSSQWEVTGIVQAIFSTILPGPLIFWTPHEVAIITAYENWLRIVENEIEILLKATNILIRHFELLFTTLTSMTTVMKLDLQSLTDRDQELGKWFVMENWRSSSKVQHRKVRKQKHFTHEAFAYIDQALGHLRASRDQYELIRTSIRTTAETSSTHNRILRQMKAKSPTELSRQVTTAVNRIQLGYTKLAKIFKQLEREDMAAYKMMTEKSKQKGKSGKEVTYDWTEVFEDESIVGA